MTDVTVLTPSLGYGRYIEDNIVSVLKQDGLEIQHVVQDGGSTDQTLEILKRYDSTLVWESETDRGQSDALNKALQRATGRWIAWLNADEFYLPSGLAALVARGDRTSADAVYGDNLWVDEEGRVTRLFPHHPFSTSVLRSYGCFFASSSMILRRSSLPEQPWDPDIRMMMDWDLYLTLSARGARFESIDYPVGAFRRHSEQVTARPEVFGNEYDKLLAKHNIPVATRRWGRSLHRLAKLRSGAYLREHRIRAVRGYDLRWFRSEAGVRNFQRLLREAYGIRDAQEFLAAEKASPERSERNPAD